MVTSAVSHRRGRQAIVKLVGALVLCIVVGIALLFTFSGERINHYRYEAAIQPDGSAMVREVIDYDFGRNARHGLRRTLPGYRIEATDQPGSGDVITEMSVDSASAPHEYSPVYAFSGELRVGDPAVTIRGRHQYVLQYRLPDALSGGRLALNVVGTGWDVPIYDVEATITVPANVANLECFRGGQSERGACETVSATGDRITISDRTLDSGQGITVYGDLDTRLHRTELSLAPTPLAGDAHWYWRATAFAFGFALLGYLLALIAVARFARTVGRDWAWHGAGPADSVYGHGKGLSRRRIRDELAANDVVLQYVPPKGISPAEGGLILRERIKNEHRVAWIIGQVLDGWITLDRTGKKLSWAQGMRSRNNTAPKPLRSMLAGKDAIKLDKYNASFAKGWNQIDDELRTFQRTGEMWDTESEKRSRVIVTWIGWAGFFSFCGLTFAVTATIRPMSILSAVVAACAGVAFGLMFAAMADRGELPVRTPKGYAAYQLVEGFRHFFVGSETQHVKAAAQAGRMREYSAWAVALDEVDHWNALITSAGIVDDPEVEHLRRFTTFSDSVATATMAPSSSSGSSSSFSSSSSSGGVGGGGGGGGGGSW